ncbi:MAG: hypothetical protein KDE27_10230 [Planctomycetes bacterium]|nr:hypothetical protein [Planctomycetota bacterium]
MRLASSVLVLALAGCSLQISGNHRPVGKVDAPIADAAGIERVEIENVAGKITVRACAAADAAVKAEVLLTEDRPESDFRADFASHVEVRREGKRLIVKNRHADTSDQNDWQLHLEVAVPAGVALDIEQAAGIVDVALPSSRDIAVANAAGEIAVDVPALDGKLVAHGSTGEIDVRIAERGPTGGCDLDCAAGNVTLTLPQDVAGSFDLGATVGNVSVADRFGLQTEREITSARARGKVGTGEATFRARTATGNVTVR